MEYTNDATFCCHEDICQGSVGEAQWNPAAKTKDTGEPLQAFPMNLI